MKKRVLIVEDEWMTSIFLKKTFELEGFEIIDTVSTGEESVELAKISTPDLILMDIHLAGKMDGIEAAESIKKEINTPIIFTSGYSDQSIKDAALALNPIAYLEKPLNVSLLFDKISKYFDQ
jgi:CheY-like chemotaxis protein